MNFDWDEEKNISNFEKHGVWFEEAQTVWAFEWSIEFFDVRHSQWEQRFIKIGFSSLNRVLIVIFKEIFSTETIRIISARKATRKERVEYGKRI